MFLDDWVRTPDLDRWIGISEILQTNIDETLIIVVILFILHRLGTRAAHRNIAHLQGLYVARKLITYSLVVIAMLIVAMIWSDSFQTVGVLLGFASLGIALALRTVIASLVAWVYIVARNPFRIGDRIEISGRIGHVVDIEVFHFVIIELKDWGGEALPTGRVVRIPNNNIFMFALVNGSIGFHYMWDEIVVPFALGSDLEHAKQFVCAIVARHAVNPSTLDAEIRRRIHTQFLMPEESLHPSPLVAIDPNGVKITVRYLCETTRRSATAEAIWMDLLTSVNDEPTITLVGSGLPNHPTEAVRAVA